MEPPIIVHSEIEFPLDMETIVPKNILVEVEDISRADAAAQVVARHEFTPGPISGGARIPVLIEVLPDALDQRHSYSVRVHVDVNGSGEINRGDFITMQSYPVLTHGYGAHVHVSVRQV